MEWDNKNVLKVIIAGLHLLFYLGCSDFQFLSISVSAQTTSFIPACDNVTKCTGSNDWLTHNVMCANPNPHMLHHDLNC